jgi:hypothetical protein
MKTLLITTLTTALLSFNSFADNTSDIQIMASQIAEKGLLLLNTKLDISSSVKAQNYLNTLALTTESKSFVLVAKVAKNQRYQTKNTIQAEDE